MGRAPDLHQAFDAATAAASTGYADPDAPAISARTRRVLPIDLSAIRVGKRLRPIDRDAVARIAYSMATITQQQPISVRMDPDDPAKFVLVAGAHRLEAARTLGWPQIEALIVDAPEHEQRLIEIDENLARADLTPLDRARFLAERKKVFLKLHPDRRRGGDRSSREFAEARNTHPTNHASWAEETAEHISLSPRAVRRAVAIGEGIQDELADALSHTPIAQREGDLYRLSQMDADDQAGALNALRSADTTPANLAALIGPTASTPPQDPLDRLKRAWQSVSPETREQFLLWLEEGGWPSHSPNE